MTENPIILFDGVCNLCNNAVIFVIKRDQKSVIRFAPLQSEIGRRLLKQYHLSEKIVNSFILIEKGKAWTQSSAALKLCRYLSGLWPLLYGFIIVPKFIRNGIYNRIAKNRYKWFGKKDQCMIPAPELASRFLM